MMTTGVREVQDVEGPKSIYTPYWTPTGPELTIFGQATIFEFQRYYKVNSKWYLAGIASVLLNTFPRRSEKSRPIMVNFGGFDLGRGCTNLSILVSPDLVNRVLLYRFNRFHFHTHSPLYPFDRGKAGLGDSFIDVMPFVIQKNLEVADGAHGGDQEESRGRVGGGVSRPPEERQRRLAELGEGLPVGATRNHRIRLR